MRRFVVAGVVLLGVALTIPIVLADPLYIFPWGSIHIAALAIGAIVVWQIPRQPVGWILMALGLVNSISIGMFFVSGQIDDPNPAAWLEAIGNALSVAGILLLPLTLLVFPDGTLVSRRWKTLIWSGGFAALAGAGASMLNGGWGGDQEQADLVSPLYDATTPLGDILSSLFFVSFLITIIGSAVSLILRYRRSFGDKRQQIKWIAYAATLILTTVLTMLITNGLEDVATGEPWQALVVSAAFAAIPIAVGIAILKYRLYDIDIVINRTLVLVLLAGFITMVYALVVVVVGSLVVGESDSLVLQITATAIVAVAFEPARSVAQRWANRLVFGRRATPYEVLSDLMSRLSDSEEGQGILQRMAERLTDGTGAERATIWLGSGAAIEHGASWPLDTADLEAPDLSSESVFPVTHDQVVVGAIEVVKPRGMSLSSAERSLIADLAGSTGAVLGYQRLNDSLQQRASQLAVSRARIVDAQDIERQRIERQLHDGAHQQILGIKLKVGVAAQLAETQEQGDLAAMLAGLGDDAQAALEEIDALAKGVFPPVLQMEGLEAAVRELAAGAPVPVFTQIDKLSRHPAEIEAAIYFDVAEAVTNAVKHASPPITVRLSDDDGSIRFAVTDNGSGFDVTAANGGRGLKNMSDRIDAIGGELEVTSGPEGTTVRASVPMKAESSQPD